MALTAKQVQNAKPGRHFDGRGLYMLVKPSGARSWVLRVQFNGVRRDYGLGSVLDKSLGNDALPLQYRKFLTLNEARDKAKLGRDLAKAGINLSEAWRHQAVTVIPTFEEAAREYHKHAASGWRKGKHSGQWISTLETYVFPLIGSRRVDQVDAPAVQSVLMPIWLTIPETARRVRQRIGVVLDYAKGKGWRDSEAPMRAVDQLMRGIKQPRGGNFEALPYSDLPALVARLQAAPFSVGRSALLFLILTAARSGEVRKAKWGEVDFELAEWRVPRVHHKKDKIHIVPLVPAALDILKELRGLFGGDPGAPIFPGNKGNPMSDATLAKVFRLAGGGKATVHGLRSSFRDWAAEHNFTDAWAEAALSHGNPDKVEAAYKRTTFFNQRRDKLMPAWAAFVLDDGSNVVQLASARA